MFNYECDEIKAIIDEVSPNYPQLTTYTKEWLFFNKYHYIPGIPVDLEYQLIEGQGLQTAYNVIPFDYKVAKLKGNTLVNCIKTNSYSATNWPRIDLKNILVKPNTKYIAIINYLPVNCQWSITNTGESQTAHVSYNKNMYSIFTSSTTTTDILTLHINQGAQTNLTIEELQKVQPMIIEYQEGLENCDIPYFEGMQSVKRPVLTTTNADATKTNILTVNEPVELCGIGDVKDELNLLTGELTQHIREVVLDGSDDESWSIANTNDIFVDVSRFKLHINDAKIEVHNLISDKFRHNITSLINDEVCYIGGESMLYVNIHKSKLSEDTVKGFRKWLSNNPLTIQYRLATPVVKTYSVAINKPYEGTNHYHAYSDTISPIMSIEVPVVSTGNKTLLDIQQQD